MNSVSTGKKVAAGVSHPDKGEWRSVSLKFPKADGERLQSAARESGRSVAGFVRFAAMKYVEELAKEN